LATTPDRRSSFRKLDWSAAGGHRGERTGLPSRVAARGVDANAGWTALDTWRRLGLTRYPAFSFLDRVWELRDNLSAYDASYVALAELLDCTLLTADARLGRAPGIRCAITVVPR
jgi:hypothetical protein